SSGSFWQPYTGSQPSDVQALPSAQVGRPGRRQWGSQPSQSAMLPSSHSSGNSERPLPHAGQGTRQPFGTSARVVGSRPVQGGRTQPVGMHRPLPAPPGGSQSASRVQLVPMSPAVHTRHGPRAGLMILAPSVWGRVLE